MALSVLDLLVVDDIIMANPDSKVPWPKDRPFVFQGLVELVGIDDVFLVGSVVRVRARERVRVGVALAQTCVALVSFR